MAEVKCCECGKVIGFDEYLKMTPRGDVCIPCYESKPVAYWGRWVKVGRNYFVAEVD